MNKTTPEKFAKTMLKELAQIRAVVESLHDITAELLRHFSNESKSETDKLMIAKIERQRKIIYESLLKRAGFDEPKPPNKERE